MKFAKHAVLSFLFVAVLTPLMNGQQSTSSGFAQGAETGPDSNAPQSCPHYFQTGNSATNNYIDYCVTDNGNITNINTPFAHPQIGGGGEGYGLCQESPVIEYHDWAVDARGWNPPTILSSTKAVIKISRTTDDGGWTLVQTISKVAATASIKVVMALTNNQSVDKVAYLVRFADIDPDGNNGGDFFPRAFMGASLESAWGWNEKPPFRGLVLQNQGKSAFGYQQGFASFRSAGPNACDFAANSDPDGLMGDGGNENGSVNYTYAGPVPAHQTLTVTLNYRRR